MQDRFDEDVIEELGITLGTPRRREDGDYWDWRILFPAYPPTVPGWLCFAAGLLPPLGAERPDLAVLARTAVEDGYRILPSSAARWSLEM